MGFMQYFNTRSCGCSYCRSGISVYAKKGETLDEYWQYTHYILDWGSDSPNMILDDGGDATGLLILGSKAEKDMSVLDNPTNAEEIALFKSIKSKLQEDSEFTQELRATLLALLKRLPLELQDFINYKNKMPYLFPL